MMDYKYRGTQIPFKDTSLPPEILAKLELLGVKTYYAMNSWYAFHAGSFTPVAYFTSEGIVLLKALTELELAEKVFANVGCLLPRGN